MPEFIASASDFLRFKKLQIIQDGNRANIKKNKINKERTYDADERILIISRYPFAYQKSLDLTSQTSGDVNPIHQFPAVPQINFTNSYGQYTNGKNDIYISKIYAEWLPVTDVSYYKVFISVDTAGTSSTRDFPNPVKGSSAALLFTYESDPIHINSFTFDITEGQYNAQKLSIFIFSYNSLGKRSLFPLYYLSYTLKGWNTLFLDKTTYTTDGINYFYFLDNQPDNLFAAQIDQKPLIAV